MLFEMGTLEETKGQSWTWVLGCPLDQVRAAGVEFDPNARGIKSVQGDASSGSALEVGVLDCAMSAVCLGSIHVLCMHFGLLTSLSYLVSILYLTFCYQMLSFRLSICLCLCLSVTDGYILEHADVGLNLRHDNCTICALTQSLEDCNTYSSCTCNASACICCAEQTT